MYKSKLQEVCQRRNWEMPHYSAVKEGPDHIPNFTASVTVHGHVFETPENGQFCTLKEAQNTCAQIALDYFSHPLPLPDTLQYKNQLYQNAAEGPSDSRRFKSSVSITQEDGGLCKSLLQEIAQKYGLMHPVYWSDDTYDPYVCTVKIGSLEVRGAKAKKRKQAEKNAAIAAYNALMESN